MDSVVAALEGLEAKAQVLAPLKFELFHDIAHQLADNVGLDADKMRFMLAVFAAFPLAIIYKHLPSAGVKHSFDILVGISFAQFVLGSGWIHSFVLATLSYLMVRFGPRRIAPYAVFALNLTYMSVAHLYRLYVDYMGWSLDFTGPQMVLVMKLTSFAFNYYDGVVDNVFKKAEQIHASRVYTSRKQFALSKIPSLLEFYGFVYCFPAFLAGPGFEISEYLNTTDNSKFKFKGKYTKPSNVVAALTKMIVGLVSLGLYMVVSAKYPLSMLVEPELRDHSMLFRLKTLYLVIMGMKLKYYMAWKLAESACVLCGFGFEGFNDDGSVRGWDGVSNMDIFAFETASSVRDSTRAWNKSTQAWLERYVYLRTNNSLVATYFISAFWHGFYPGYYLFFLALPIVTELARLQFKRVRPWFHPEHQEVPLLHYTYEVLSVVSNQTLCTYLVMAFFLMSWTDTMAAYANFQFAGHFAMVGLYLVYSLMPVPKRKI